MVLFLFYFFFKYYELQRSGLCWISECPKSETFEYNGESPGWSVCFSLVHSVCLNVGLTDCLRAE